MPALVTIGIVAGVFMLALKLKAPIGFSFLGISIILGLLAGMPILEITIIIGKRLIAFETLRLVGIVYLISLIGLVLAKAGVLSRTVDSLRILISDRRIGMVIPASLIGLLPMPGGAMLSAPMVEEGSRDFDISRDRLTFLNFWFRHIWEYVWPLYPGIVLSTGLLEIHASKLIAPMWPLTIVAIIVGGLIGFKGLKLSKPDEMITGSKIAAFASFMKLTWYIWTVVVFVLFFGFDILPIVAICAMLMLLFAKYPSREKIVFLKNALLWKVLTLVAGVMIFKGVLESSGILGSLTDNLGAVPDFALLFAIPFSIGFLTGVNSAYIGLGFPLLLSLFLPSGGGFDAGNFALAYSAGFAGVLLSPVHLCLSLTREYFDAKWGGIYRYLIPSIAVVFVFAIGIMLIF